MLTILKNQTRTYLYDTVHFSFGGFLADSNNLQTPRGIVFIVSSAVNVEVKDSVLLYLMEKLLPLVR